MVEERFNGYTEMQVFWESLLTIINYIGLITSSEKIKGKAMGQVGWSED